jgi:hypothetical protein
VIQGEEAHYTGGRLAVKLVDQMLSQKSVSGSRQVLASPNGIPMEVMAVLGGASFKVFGDNALRRKKRADCSFIFASKRAIIAFTASNVLS